jgi:hypothetical protein
VVPFLGALVHQPDVGLGGLQDAAADIADQPGQSQVALDDVLLVDVELRRLVDVDEVGVGLGELVVDVGLDVLGERPVDVVGVVDERGLVGLDAVPQVRWRLVVVIVGFVLLGDGREGDRGPPHQGVALVDSVVMVGGQRGAGRKQVPEAPAALQAVVDVW